MDANVQKIVDAGFSEEQAENALKYTKNNVDRALKILQKRDHSENRSKEKQQKEPEPPKRKGRSKDINDEDIQVKPSGKVSLFDFLEDKLPNVPERDKNNRQSSTSQEDRNDRNNLNYRERNSAKNLPRNQGSRYEGPNRQRSEARGHYSHENHSHRDERKYQAQSEKPPRFQKKLEEKNKQQLQQQQQQHIQQSQQFQVNMMNNMNMHYNNSYHTLPPPPQSHYNDKMRTDRNYNENKVQQQHNYRNAAGAMESLVDATGNLSLLANQRAVEELQQPRNYPPLDQVYAKQAYVPAQSVSDAQPFRRGSDLQKYQEQSYQRRQQPNGYVEPRQNAMYPSVASFMGNAAAAAASGYGGRQYYGARAQEYAGVRGAPFLTNSLLGFQNAAVNEQARAMLGVTDINWKVGDRCLALYWEDNNVS